MAKKAKQATVLTPSQRKKQQAKGQKQVSQARKNPSAHKTVTTKDGGKKCVRKSDGKVVAKGACPK